MIDSMEAFEITSQDRKNLLIITAVYFIAFLLITPLGPFEDEIPYQMHTGKYSLTTLDVADEIGYYSYLRSAFFDGDIDFCNEKDFYYRLKITPTGYAHNHWAIGCAILWIPFFLLGHLITQIYHFLGYITLSDGYFAPYYVFVSIGSMIYVFLGLLFSYRILRRFSSPFAALISTLVVFLSTHLPYYAFVQSRLSHAGEFFLITLFVDIWLYWRSTGKETLTSFILGAVAGLIITIRNNSATFLVLLFFDFVKGAKNDSRNSEKAAWTERLAFLKPFGLGLFLSAFPQLLAWHTIFGKLSPPLDLYGNFLYNFVNPYVWITTLPELFFSPTWGLVFSQPVWILGLWGLYGFTRDKPRFGIPFLCALGLSMLVTIAYIKEFGGEFAFGHRMLLSCNIFISLGLARLIDGKIDGKPAFSKSLWLFVGFVLIFLQYIILVQYEINLDWSCPGLSWKALRGLGWLVSESPHLLIRSTSYLKVMTVGWSLFNSYKAWFYMIFLPIILLSFLFLARFLFTRVNGKAMRNSKFRTALGALLGLFLLGINIAALHLHHPKSFALLKEQIPAAVSEAITAGYFDVALNNWKVALEMGFPRQILDDMKFWILSSNLAFQLSYHATPPVSFANLFPRFDSFSIIFIKSRWKYNLAFVIGDYPIFGALVLGFDQMGMYISYPVPWMFFWDS